MASSSAGGELLTAESFPRRFTAHWKRRHLPFITGILPFQEYDLHRIGWSRHSSEQNTLQNWCRQCILVFLPRCQLDTITGHQGNESAPNALQTAELSSRPRGQHAAMDIPMSLIQLPHLPTCNGLAMRKSLTFRILLLQPSGQWVRKESKVEQAWWRAETSGPLSLNAFCTTEIARHQGHTLPSPPLPHVMCARLHGRRKDGLVSTACACVSIPRKTWESMYVTFISLKGSKLENTLLCM